MRKLLVLAPALVLVLAACAAGASPSPSAAAPSVAAPSPPGPASMAPASEQPTATETAGGETPGAPGEATVMVAESDLGQIVVDGEGLTLYLFTPDEQGDPTCYDACAENWPPLLAEGEITAGEGLDDGDFSTVSRTDGGEQVTFNGWPLYYFANDAAPGDTNGQGLNDVWFVVSPEGDAIG